MEKIDTRKDQEAKRQAVAARGEQIKTNSAGTARAFGLQMPLPQNDPRAKPR